MIKFEHTIFALPFAYLGAFLAKRGFPGWWATLWILVAMIGARSAAMAFNRLADWQFDAENPRTRERALPKGLVSGNFVAAFTLFSGAVFLFAAYQLNPLAFALSPLALGIVLAYSYTKRFTSLSHVFLGLSLGIAPVGGWIAVTGRIAAEPFVLAGAVLFWVAGFDVIYACQDVDFDVAQTLHSIPARLGIGWALLISAGFHLAMLVLLAWVFLNASLGVLSWVGLALVAIALVYEHLLVKPGDLSRVNAAFFGINGVISIILFVFVGLDLCLAA
jgi:4-hydroxybenzoate polyprenyltransferase